jgi:pimeloyl-ACP methyl ester carboxylesterase
MGPLAAAGLHVVAPDLRGYHLSDRPQGVSSYSIGKLAGDVVGLVRAMDADDAFVVGHDWGGGVAWATAMFHPERVRRLAILNSVHPIGFLRALRTWEQMKRSLYIFFFQIPWLPEEVLKLDDFAWIRRAFTDDGVPAEEAEGYVAAMRPRDALTAALAFYRASFRDGLAGRTKPKKVTLPVLVIWGDRDRFLVPSLAVPPADWVTNARVERIPEASHWVQRDAPERVNALLLEHFEVATNR